MRKHPTDFDKNKVSTLKLYVLCRISHESEHTPQTKKKKYSSNLDCSMIEGEQMLSLHGCKSIYNESKAG